MIGNKEITRLPDSYIVLLINDNFHEWRSIDLELEKVCLKKIDFWNLRNNCKIWKIQNLYYINNKARKLKYWNVE